MTDAELDGPERTVYRLDDDCTPEDVTEGAYYHATVDATVPYGMEDQFERPQYAIEEAQDLTEWFSEEEVDRAKESQEGWVKLLRETGW